MAKEIETPKQHPAKKRQNQHRRLPGSFSLVQPALGQGVLNGFAVGLRIDKASEWFRHGASIGQHVTTVQPLQPNFGGQLEQNQSQSGQNRKVESAHTLAIISTRQPLRHPFLLTKVLQFFCRYLTQSSRCTLNLEI